MTISKSSVKGKKWEAKFLTVGSNNKVQSRKTIHFGATGYKDYTTGATEEQRKAYLARHAKDPREHDTAGNLSREILWGKSKSMKENIKSYKSKFNMI